VVTSIVGGNSGSDYGYRTPLALENGDIVVGGGGTTDFALARYTLSGSLDTTFGSGGIVTTATGSGPYISNLLVLPDGQIVAVGNVGLSWALARYNLNGSLDSTFGTGGIVTSNITGTDRADNAALQANGQIVVVGWGALDSTFETGVYNANGSLDTSFGSGGIVTQPLFNDPSGAPGGGGVVVQPGGKIVTASSATVYVVSRKNIIEQWHFMLARYGPSAAQIGSFTASPNPVTSGSSLTLTASNITLADPSSTITQVAVLCADGRHQHAAGLRHAERRRLDLHLHGQPGARQLHAHRPSYRQRRRLRRPVRTDADRALTAGRGIAPALGLRFCRAPCEVNEPATAVR
jgi:uncharacterized delta-60 repeat protein